VRRRLRPAGGALAALALAASAGGCGVGGEGQSRALDVESVPFGLLDAEAAPVVTTAPPEPTGALTVCFVDPDGQVVALPVPVEGAPSIGTALEALGSLPVEGTELTTAVPEERTVVDVDVEGGVATVDLAAAFDELVPAADELTYVAQVVCTLTGLPGVGQVAFTRDGDPVGVPTAGGALSTLPVSRDDYAELISRS
jgi:spore germination protein GerM